LNFTVSGAYRSDNDLVSIRSQELAEDCLVEFEEMFTDRQSGPNSRPTPHFPNKPDLHQSSARSGKRWKSPTNAISLSNRANGEPKQ
jgi:hypothetical protein